MIYLNAQITESPCTYAIHLLKTILLHTDWLRFQVTRFVAKCGNLWGNLSSSLSNFQYESCPLYLVQTWLLNSSIGMPLDFQHWYASRLSSFIMSMEMCRVWMNIPHLLSVYRIWFYWGVDPLSYAQKGMAINEFRAPRYQQVFASPDLTIGDAILAQRGLPRNGYNRALGFCVLVSHLIRTLFVSLYPLFKLQVI